MNKLHGKRCTCGGIMKQEIKFDSLLGEDKVWYVCPFCGAKKLVPTTSQEKGDESEDQILTQPTRG